MMTEVPTCKKKLECGRFLPRLILFGQYPFQIILPFQINNLLMTKIPPIFPFQIVSAKAIVNV